MDLLDVHPTSLWDPELRSWCQQIKETPRISQEEAPDTLQPHEGDSGQQLPEESVRNQDTATDDFAFDMSAFQPAASKPGPDAFAFDAGAFEEESGNLSQRDPYAFDPSSFSRQPTTAAADAPQLQEDSHEADPFAFYASAFEAKADPESTTKPSQADPFAFDMEAFQEPGFPEPSAATQTQSADPFAFDMSAFDASPHGGAAEEDKPMKSATTPQRIRSATEPEPKGRERSSPKAQAIKKAPQRVEDASVSKPPRGPISFQKRPKAAFQPLSATELAALEELLQPEKLSGSQSSGSSSEAESEPDLAQQQGGIPQVAAEHIVWIAKAVSNGVPGSLAETPALDHAGQMAACGFQVCVSHKSPLPFPTLRSSPDSPEA